MCRYFSSAFFACSDPHEASWHGLQVEREILAAHIQHAKRLQGIFGQDGLHGRACPIRGLYFVYNGWGSTLDRDSSGKTVGFRSVQHDGPERLLKRFPRRRVNGAHRSTENGLSRDHVRCCARMH